MVVEDLTPLAEDLPLLRGDCIAEARRYGFRVLMIDGRLDVDQVTSRVERHFGFG